MKTSMYFNYTTRSLLRGGQRTILAVFCVAVGVMAIVALQLVGLLTFDEHLFLCSTFFMFDAQVMHSWPE